MRDLRHPHQLRADHRDADRAADVARQIEESRRRGAHPRRERLKREALERDEDEAEAESLDDTAHDHRPRRLIDGEPGHHVQRDAHQADADAHQQPRIEPARKPSRHQHRDQGADTARRGQESRLQHRIAVKILKQRRQQRQAREQQHAGHSHERHSGGEITVLEHRSVEQRIPGRDHMHDEHP